MKRAVKPTSTEQKPELDLAGINTMLKNSFGAIKIDMIHLKDAQEAQLRDMGSLKKELKEFRHTIVTKEEVKKSKERLALLEKHQKHTDSKIEETEKHIEEVVEAVNQRLKELNKEFKKILTIKDDLKYKLKSLDDVQSDVKELRAKTVTKVQMKQVLDDVNGEFDKVEERLAAKKDVLKLAKRVDKLEKKK